MGKLMYQGENLTGAPPLLGSLKDVNITSPSNNDVIKYNSTTQKWENGAGGGGSLDIDSVTQAEYDALTPEEKLNPSKIYDITDANLVNADIDDTTTSLGKTWSSSKINLEIQGSGLIHKTQEEYDALPSADKSDPTKHYLITNATLSGAPLDDTAISNGKVWSSNKVNNELTDIQDDISTLNSALEWKTLRNDSGGSVVLPDNIKEFYCLAKFSTSGAYSQVGMFAANALVDGPTWHISNAYYITFTRSTRSFTVTQVLNNTHNPAEKIIVYWR